jgi:4-hydroxybenzoate polyprenyltransferase
MTREELKKVEGHVDTILAAWLVGVVPTIIILNIWDVLSPKWFFTAVVILFVLTFYSIALKKMDP